MVIGAFGLPLLRTAAPAPTPMQVARSITAPLPTPMQVAQSIATPSVTAIAKAIPSLSVAPPRLPVAAPLSAAAAMAMQVPVGLPPPPKLGLGGGALPSGGGESPAPLSSSVSAPVGASASTVQRTITTATDGGVGHVTITDDHPSVSDPAQVTPVAGVDPGVVAAAAGASSPMMASAPVSAAPVAAADASTSHGLSWAFPAAIVGGVGLLALGAYFIFRR